MNKQELQQELRDKQFNAIEMRSDINAQTRFLQEREADLQSTETIIAFERKFFMGRRQAQKFIDTYIRISTTC